MKMALANTTMDKVAFCREYGVEICYEAWPCVHLPISILGDRGELESQYADELAGTLGIKVSNTPPYRADWKGMVEQTFRLLNLKVIKWLPGAVKERYRERGEPDHRWDSTFDITEFIRLMILTVLDFNLNHRIKQYPRDEYMIKNKVEPIPIELWNWGIQNKSGHLRESTPEQIQLALMPRTKAVITRNGIRVNGLHYSTERAIEEQWFNIAKSRGTWEEVAAYDNRKVDTIHLILNEGKEVLPCHLISDESRFKSKRVEDVLELFEMEKEEDQKHTSLIMQSNAAYQAQIDYEIEEARKKTEEAIALTGRKKSQRIKDMKISRADMGKRINDENAQQINSQLKNSVEAPQIQEEPDEDDSSFESPRVKYLNMIKRS